MNATDEVKVVSVRQGSFLNCPHCKSVYRLARVVPEGTLDHHCEKCHKDFQVNVLPEG